MVAVIKTHDAVNNDTTLARDLIPALLAALADLRVVVLTGMRQTGKSTLLTSTKGLSRRRYATLDDFAQLEAARADPEGFLAGDEPLTIDEVQRAPELLVAVKRAAVVQPVKSIFTTTGIELLGAMSPNATLGRDCGAPPFTITVPTTGEQATPPLCTSVKLVSSAELAGPGPALMMLKLHCRALKGVPDLLVIFAPRLAFVLLVMVVGSLALLLLPFTSPPPETVAVLVTIAGALPATVNVIWITG